jgi:calcium permeable stress-gated cation channel
MLGMASLEGMVSRSKKEIRTCSMVFYFLVGNVFFLSVLSGSLLNQIGESFAHPKEIPSRLASAVSAQVQWEKTYNFSLLYIMIEKNTEVEIKLSVMKYVNF